MGLIRWVSAKKGRRVRQHAPWTAERVRTGVRDEEGRSRGDERCARAFRDYCDCVTSLPTDWVSFGLGTAAPKSDARTLCNFFRFFYTNI